MYWVRTKLVQGVPVRTTVSQLSVINYKYATQHQKESLWEPQTVEPGKRGNMCVVKDLRQVWNGRSDMKYVLSTYYCVRQSEHVCTCVWVYEWAQGCIRSKVHGGMWGFTLLKPNRITSQDKAGKSPGKPWIRFSVLTCVPLMWASSSCWDAARKSELGTL